MIKIFKIQSIQQNICFCIHKILSFKNLVESGSKVPQTHSYTSNCAIKEISSCFYKLFFEFQIFFHVFHMIYSVLKWKNQMLKYFSYLLSICEISGKSEVNDSLDRDDTCILIFIYKSKAGQLNVFILMLVKKEHYFTFFMFLVCKKKCVRMNAFIIIIYVY